MYLLDTFLEEYDPANQAYDPLTGQKMVQQELCADRRKSGNKVNHKPILFFIWDQWKGMLEYTSLCPFYCCGQRLVASQ